MTGSPRTAACADAWLALALVPGLAPQVAFELAARLGGPDAVLDAPPEVLDAAGCRRKTIDVVRGARGRAEREREALCRAGATLVAWDDPAYPQRLRAIPDPPLALMVRGALGPPDDLAIAVVGARRAGEYGRHVAFELARGLAQAGLTVVSGLAAGIDGASHRGALDAGGRTIAVMATGVDRVYPSWHRDLAREIAREGALVTEFPYGTPPLQHHFPQRNRIVAGLAVGVVVVEAALGSGSLITARCALDQGREVFAVPGPVGTAAHVGCHRLIQDGARLVMGVDDVLETIAPALVAQVRAARAREAEASLTAPERALLDAMDEGAVDEGASAVAVDALVARTRLAPAAALETLLALELRGVVAQRPGGRWVRMGKAA